MGGQEAVDEAVAESARTGVAVNARQCLRIAREWEHMALEADTENVRMTPKEMVLRRNPQAFAVEDANGWHVFKAPGHRIATATTEDRAWEAALRHLKGGFDLHP